MKVPRTLMGVETEYAFSGEEAGMPSRNGDLLMGLIQTIRRSHASLPSQRGRCGMFLSNGGRFYLDCGHPEFATPECPDPWTATRYVRAGERMLVDAAPRVGLLLAGPGRISFFRFQVDYGQAGAVTWGCHESYLYRSPPARVYGSVLPHLVSRVVLAGAGGFNPRSDGIDFTLSPRAWTLEQEISVDSTGNRGIVHAKDESLAGRPWRRLHLLCGESLGCDVASVLKLGTTALVVATAEAGELPTRELELASPLDALRTFSSDPSCTGTAPLAHGGSASAIDLQRALLGAVRRFEAGGGLPPWAGELCALWDRTLRALETDRDSLIGRLDWVTKKILFDEWLGARLAESGFEPDWATRWTEVFIPRDETSDPGGPEPPSDRPASSATGPSHDVAVDRIGSRARALALSHDTLPAFRRLRSQLQEIDVRFGELGDGIHDRLVRAGRLGGSLFEEPAIREAMDVPPPVGRAALRGRTILDLSRSASTAWAGWTSIFDLEERRILPLADPWAEESAWRTRSESEDPLPF